MKNIFLGIDIGSTTVKLVAVSEGQIIYNKYERHYSKVREKTCEMLIEAKPRLDGNNIYVALTGSAGMGVAKASDIPFIQEVFATRKVVQSIMPDTSVVIELGGEDAKIIFLEGEIEERMNGSCAGGTGAFIDQMAVLLDVTPQELDELSLKAEKIHTIASRCGVFAKSDIQPLLNQGARKEDVAASIFQAVVDQTLTGLAQGREISGNILFLGGPLFFFKGLQKRFVETLKLTPQTARFPKIAPYAVALGASSYSENTEKVYTYDELFEALSKTSGVMETHHHLPPLFEDENEYREFVRRHKHSDVVHSDPYSYSGDIFIGIDCGSTTTKLAVIGMDNSLLYSYYSANKGNPLSIIQQEFN
ncbi:MAG: acyl-CoA dehydratase activase, partial [Oscillospiraceae bacterium]